MYLMSSNQSDCNAGIKTNRPEGHPFIALELFRKLTMPLYRNHYVYGTFSLHKLIRSDFLFSEKVSLFCGNLDPDLTGETLKGFFEANGIEVIAARKSERKRYFLFSRKTIIINHIKLSPY